MSRPSYETETAALVASGACKESMSLSSKLTGVGGLSATFSLSRRTLLG